MARTASIAHLQEPLVQQREIGKRGTSEDLIKFENRVSRLNSNDALVITKEDVESHGI
jgi:hypothetical protein